MSINRYFSLESLNLLHLMTVASHKIYMKRKFVRYKIIFWCSLNSKKFSRLCQHWVACTQVQPANIVFLTLLLCASSREKPLQSDVQVIIRFVFEWDVWTKIKTSKNFLALQASSNQSGMALLDILSAHKRVHKQRTNSAVYRKNNNLNKSHPLG